MQIGIREIIFLIVLLAVPVASFVFVFMPRNEQIRLATDEVDVKQARLDKLAEVADKIDDLGLAIERGRLSIELIDTKLPDEQDVEGMLEQVWRLAEGNGLSVKSVKSDKRVPAALYMEQPLKTVLEGPFDGFYEFMLQLENLPRITRIHDMKLARIGGARGSNDEDTPPGSMRAEFTLSIYFKPQGGTNN